VTGWHGAGVNVTVNTASTVPLLPSVTAASAIFTVGSRLVTVTLKVQVLINPCRSVAVLVTRVVPTGKAKPLTGTLTTVGAPQLSDALTLKTTLLVH